jgi:predicted RNase H-like HicB family nuclease
MEEDVMKAELTAIIDEAPEGGYWAICPEIPGANRQGETKEEAEENLREAVALIFEDRLEDSLRSIASGAVRETISVGWDWGANSVGNMSVRTPYSQNVTPNRPHHRIPEKGQSLHGNHVRFRVQPMCNVFAGE